MSDLLFDTEGVGSELQQHMGEIEAGVANLRALIRALPLRQARVFPLPRIKAGEEHAPYERIEPEVVEGEEARDLALSAFGEFYGGDGASTKAVYRLPGVVVLQEDQGLQEWVDQINSSKQQFAETVQRIEDRTVRFELVHRLFPMLITLQVTRQIQLYREEMRSITFTWGRKSSIRVVERDEVLENLKRLRHQKPLAFEPERWQQLIEEDMVRLLSLPKSASLRYRRDLKVRPLANLLLTDGTKRLREANLPILLTNPGADFRVGMLGIFDAEVKPRRGRKNPQRLTEDERFLNCLPVYRAKD